MRLGTADVLVRAKTGQYKKDLKSAETRTQQFGKRAVASVGQVTASFASLAGVAGIGGLTVATVRMGSRFESQMATVRGVMRASETDFQELTDAAKLMGETTEWSGTQSAEALNYMGMAGYSAEQAIKALPGVLNLATAAGMDLGRASDIVTDSLTAMGMGVEDLERFNDVLTATTTRSNTTIEMMGESLRYVAPIASQLGYEIEPLAAMIGTLANSGIKASDAGTDLRQAMIKNKKAAQELGTAETDLIGTLRAAREAGWDVNEITDKYGLIASKSVLVLMNQLDAYDQLEKQLHDVAGETDNLAKIKLDTLTGDFKTLKSAIEGVGIASYDSIKGELRENVQDLTEFVREHKDDIVVFAESSAKLAGDLATIAAEAGQLTSTVLTGWNALPKIVQEVGLVGAVVGGKKGTAVIAGYLAVLGHAKESLDEFIAGWSAPVDTSGGLEETKKKIVEVEQALAKYEKGSRRYKNRLGGLVYKQHQQENLLKLKQLLAELTQQSEKAAETPAPLANLETEAPKVMATLYDVSEAVGEIPEELEKLPEAIANVPSIEIPVELRLPNITTDIEVPTATAEPEMPDLSSLPQPTAVSMNIDIPDWQFGAISAFHDYETAALDATANVQQAVNGSFSSLEDTLVNFASTGKLAFSDMVTSMLADLMRLVIRQSITAPLAGALSSGLSSLFSTTAVASAHGNVFTGSGIAAYENQIVSCPTLFPFAQGTGLMGEAGPEAILPLERTSSGDLGVKTTGQEQRSATQIHIHEAAGTTARVEESSDGQRMDVIIEQVEKAIQGRMNRGAGMASYLDGRYRRRY